MKQREINNLKQKLENLKIKNKEQKKQISLLEQQSHKLSYKLFLLNVNDYQKKHSCSRTDAIKAIVKTRPELHEAYKTYKPAPQLPSRPPEQHAFFAEVDKVQLQDQCNRATAINKVRKADPALHKAYVSKRPGIPQAKTNQSEFFNKVDEFQQQWRCTRTEAIKATVKAYPDLHALYKQGLDKTQNL